MSKKSFVIYTRNISAAEVVEFLDVVAIKIGIKIWCGIPFLSSFLALRRRLYRSSLLFFLQSILFCIASTWLTKVFASIACVFLATHFMELELMCYGYSIAKIVQASSRRDAIYQFLSDNVFQNKKT